MVNDPRQDEYGGPLRRLLMAVIILGLLGILLVWRIDNPRVERMRTEIVDRVVPSFDWISAPITGAVGLLTDFQSYQRLAEQNRNLRRELQQMKAWREAALQLEQKNAKLLDLNNLKVDAKLTYVTGIVLADSGSPFRQSVLLNIGARDGIRDGWPAMDGMGLVGRISGVGNETARVILLTDSNSRVPVTIQPSGQRAVIAGDNSLQPLILFLDDVDTVQPGDRVVSSGDGGVFPGDLLVGQIVLGKDRRLRTRLSADYEQLDFLRVLRATGSETISAPGGLVLPDLSYQGPPVPTGGDE